MNDRDRTHIELFAQNGAEYQAGSRIDRKAVYTAYVESCDHAGLHPVSPRRFTPAFRAGLTATGIDYAETRSQGGRYWNGIALTGAVPPARLPDNPTHAFHAGLIDNLYTITAHLRAERPTGPGHRTTGSRNGPGTRLDHEGQGRPANRRSRRAGRVHRCVESTG